MSRILLVYASHYGHTATIARYDAAVIASRIEFGLHRLL